jgi:hypothetical protein
VLVSLEQPIQIIHISRYFAVTIWHWTQGLRFTKLFDHSFLIMLVNLGSDYLLWSNNQTVESF